MDDRVPKPRRVALEQRGVVASTRKAETTNEAANSTLLTPFRENIRNARRTKGSFLPFGNRIYDPLQRTRAALLVCRGATDAVDHQNLDLGFPRHQTQAELFVECGRERGIAGVRTGIQVPVGDDVERHGVSEQPILRHSREIVDCRPPLRGPDRHRPNLLYKEAHASLMQVGSGAVQLHHSSRCGR
jgi:hypothetical protein